VRELGTMFLRCTKRFKYTLIEHSQILYTKFTTLIKQSYRTIVLILLLQTTKRIIDYLKHLLLKTDKNCGKV